MQQSQLADPWVGHEKQSHRAGPAISKPLSSYGCVSSGKYWVKSLSPGVVCYRAMANLYRNQYSNTILKYTILALGLDGRWRLKKHNKEMVTETGTLLYNNKTSGKTVTGMNLDDRKCT